VDAYKLLQSNLEIYLVVVGILSAFIGSFLNVVIIRVPIMLHNLWTNYCQEFLELKLTKFERYNLFLPLSECVHCRTPIKWYDNIPIISYLLLRAKCRYCKGNISIQYPLVELFTVVFSVITAWQLGLNQAGLFGLFFVYVCIALSVIDIKHQILPDEMVLSTLWLGLIINLNNTFTSIHSAIWGTIIGYLVLWLLFWCYKLIKGLDGIGYGDFKFFACLGAWFGVEYLPLILIIASITGSIVGIMKIVFSGGGRYTKIPFGPFLALGGWCALIGGQPLYNLYSRLMFISF